MEKTNLIISNLVYCIAHENDELAFRRLFDMYYARLLQLAYMILRNNELAEDTVLDVFTKIWSNRAKLPEIESFNKYLYVLVKNKALDQLRKNKDLIHVELTETTLSEHIVNQNPEKIILEQELVHKINQAILQLPEKCRMVYRLVKEEGHSYQDAADLLNVSRKTIDNHINLAMHRIRDSITEYLSSKDDITGQQWKIIRTLACVFMV